jgi:hypothetical protein
VEVFIIIIIIIIISVGIFTDCGLDDQHIIIGRLKKEIPLLDITQPYFQ